MQPATPVDAESLGLLAGLLTTIAFIPQVVRTWRSRSAADLSPVTFTIFAAGVALWLAYGLWLQLWPVIIANAVTLALVLVLLALRVRFMRDKRD